MDVPLFTPHGTATASKEDSEKVDDSARVDPLRKHGFALVISLGLMAFILLLILSLTTFVRVETRNSSQQKNLSQAKQAALLGLQVALGQLQQYTGPDQRVTSSALIIEGSTRITGSLYNPHWTGVWKNSAVSSMIPGNTSYSPQLLTWLVSGNESVPLPSGISDAIIDYGPEANMMRNVEQLSPSSYDTSVTVVGAGSSYLSTDDLDGNSIEDGGGIAVPIVTIGDQIKGKTSRYGYWIGDEGVKARIDLRDPLQGASPDSSQGRTRLAVPGRNAAEILSRDSSDTPSSALWGTDFLVNSADSERIWSADELVYLLNTDDLTSKALVNTRFHDISLWSRGLLTDAENGGLKSDLTTATRFSNSDWSTFKDTVAGGLIPPDLIFPPENKSSASPQDPGGPSWDVLRSFVQNSPLNSNSKLSPSVHSPTNHGYAPIIQEFKMFIGLSISGTGASRRIRMHFMPAVTLWNPYDHTLSAQDYYMAFGSLYARIDSHVGLNPTHWAEAGGSGTPDLDARLNPHINWSTIRNPPQITPDRIYRFEINCPDIPPGRAIVFSPPDGGSAMALSENIPTSTAPFNRLSPGWRSGSNYYLDSDFQNGGALLATDEVHHVSLSGGSGVYSDLRLGLSPSGFSNDPLLVIHDILYWTLDYSSSNGGFLHLQQDKYPLVTLSGTGSSPLGTTPFTDALGNYETASYEPVLGYWMQLRMSEKVLPEPYDLPQPWLKSYNPRGPFYGETLIEKRTGAPRGFTTLPSYYKLLALDNFSTLYNVNSNGIYTFPGFSVSSLSGEKSVLFRAFENDDDFISIGDLMHANLIPDVGNSMDNMAYLNYGSNYPSYAVGSSSQSPYIQADSTSPYRTTWPADSNNLFYGGEDLVFYDLPYLLNEALWDRFYFSSIDSSATMIANSRLTPIDKSSFTNYDPQDAQSFAANFYVNGAFNVNSTSVDAWASVLGAFLGVSSAESAVTPSQSLMNRVPFPQGSAFEDGGFADDENAWSGSRKLDLQEIRALAKAIVAEVKLRGPFLSLSNFINREIQGTAGSPTRARGLLDAAIQNAGINDSLAQDVGTSPMALTQATFDSLETYNGGYSSFSNYNIDALLEPLVENISSALSQPDLMAKFGSILNVRSDTFTIRVYGDTLNAINGNESARVWAEAVVQRIIEPVQAQTGNPNEPNANTTNTLGRRLKVISFRWLNQEDV